MKFVFYFGIVAWILFEIASVYFIMPMPGSQKAETIDLAYFLHSWQWIFRGVLGLCILVSIPKVFRRQRILSVIALLLLGAVIYMFNFKMKAEKMFYQPTTLLMQPAADNHIPEEKLVLGYTQDGEARAYPIQLIAYHHQVLDTVGGEQVMVTYCSVCRSGRIFKPEIEGKPASFRLVGMDHFNAMFEDNHTGSWWRQATGEAITGEYKGKMLPELLSEQMTLAQWLKLFPNSLIMQYDSTFQAQYDSLDTYDVGLGRGKLTGTDTLSWNDKSWVVGIVMGNESRAYDWNQLKREKLIHDIIGQTPIVIAIASDTMSFAVFKRSADMTFTITNDTLLYLDHKYDFTGRAVDPLIVSLDNVPAYQEFWHSWRTFHPQTLR